MIIEKSFWKCSTCGKEIDVTKGKRNFDKHLSTHNNPWSNLQYEKHLEKEHHIIKNNLYQHQPQRSDIIVK